jgi:methyl-accepting chemotaxis protein
MHQRHREGIVTRFDMRIGTRLTLGFGLSVAVALALGIIAYFTLEQVSGLTAKLYRHPFAVTSALGEIDANVLGMHRSRRI